MPAASIKTGYLDSDFRIFYLTSAEARDFQSHYHDFHKLLIFESGSVSYYIEGETYQLQPCDIVLVPAGEVHRPVIHDSTPYRRLIIYLSPALFDRYRQLGVDLGRCFALCSGRGSHVLRISHFQESRLYPQFRELIQIAREEAGEPQESARLTGASPHPQETPHTAGASPHPQETARPAGVSPHPHETARAAEASLHPHGTARLTEASLYRQSALLQFLILLNRTLGGDDISFPSASGANPQVLRVLSFINEHLSDELSVDRIADTCYLNRSYLMHLFRRETGYTLGSYITEKRLFAARALIQSGFPVTEACMRSGFSSYAAFYRAYRRKFGEPPKNSRG